MKELFGVDITTCKKNEEVDGLSYESKRISPELEAKMNRHNDEAKALDDKASLPLWLSISRWICGFGAVCVIIGTLRNIGKLSFKQMFNNAPWLFIIGAIMALIFVAVTVYALARKRIVEDSCEYEGSVDEAGDIEAAAKRELGVPDGACEIDELIYKYKTKDGENKIPEQIYGHFINGSCWVFTENGRLCICDSSVRYDVPLSDITGVDIIKKKFYMSGWNKAVMFNEEPYSEFTYKEADNLGRIWLRSVGVMRFRLQGDEFCFRFPGYELEAIERLTGVKAAEA